MQSWRTCTEDAGSSSRLPAGRLGAHERLPHRPEHHLRRPSRNLGFAAAACPRAQHRHHRRRPCLLPRQTLLHRAPSRPHCCRPAAEGAARVRTDRPPEGHDHCHAAASPRCRGQAPVGRNGGAGATPAPPPHERGPWLRRAPVGRGDATRARPGASGRGGEGARAARRARHGRGCGCGRASHASGPGRQRPPMTVRAVRDGSGARRCPSRPDYSLPPQTASANGPETLMMFFFANIA